MVRITKVNKIWINKCDRPKQILTATYSQLNSNVYSEIKKLYHFEWEKKMFSKYKNPILNQDYLILLSSCINFLENKGEVYLGNLNSKLLFI